MKHFLPALRLKIFFTILLGLGYPFVMTAIGQALFSQKVNGDFVTYNGRLVGSKWIGQNFEKPQYFWGRPSAVSYNPQPSGGSNLGQASQDLKKAVEERATKLKAAHPDQTGEIPQDLLFTSASGLDPHISPEAARYQMQRVAHARSLSVEQLQKLIEQVTEPRPFGILGEPVVNVLALNLALDQLQNAK
jgi:K+-transporting ATPase ATPase C chain